MKHAPGFLKVVEAARAGVVEMDRETLQQWQHEGRDFTLVDVREDHEVANGVLPLATHLGRGVLERDVETRFPNPAHTLVLYCGGGFRSALAAQSLQTMGYTSVLSLAGGVRGWTEAGLPLVPLPPRSAR